jgi:acyl carrier protein
MNVRNIVISALDKTTGLLNSPALAQIIHSGGDFELSELGVDSLTNYEIIMLLEDEIGVEIPPAILMSAKTLSELINSIEFALKKKT